MDTVTLTLVLVIVLALFFDFTNGFHDTANAMATPIATGALKPKTAVLIASILNLVGAFLSTEVAKTISGGIIREDQISSDLFPAIIFAGLIGAITWNMLTWLLGLPSSSSHALFGGLIGATIVGVGYMAIDFSVVMSKVILPALIAPLTAGIIAFTATKIAYAVTRRYDRRPDGRDGFRPGQIFTSSLVALAHGTNDAQKTMGVITLALITAGWQSADNPDPADVGHHRLRSDDRARHLHGRLADHPHPRQGPHRRQAGAGILGGVLDGSDDPLLERPRLRAVDHPGRLRLRHRIGSRPPRFGRALAHGRADHGGLAAHAPRRGAVGGGAAFIVVWLGLWGIILDTVIAVLIVTALFLRSRINAVTASNAMSEVADSGAAVKVKRNPPPTRRQRAIAREEARLRAAEAAAATAAPTADATKPASPAPKDTTKKGPQR